MKLDVDLSLIVAMTPERIIGKEGALPWTALPSDLRRFRDITKEAGTVIMGRKTFRSIIERNGKPLPARKHIVLTQADFPSDDSVSFVHSIDEAMAQISINGKKACVIGGAEIYQLFLPVVKRMHITTVHASLEGDTRFPDTTGQGWVDEDFLKRDRPIVMRYDPKDEFETSFVTFRRATFRR